MNQSLESFLRFVNLTTSGLLAGSLGFGEQALVPGWQQELPQHGDQRSRAIAALTDATNYFNAIGPVALGTAVTIAVVLVLWRPVPRVWICALAGLLLAASALVRSQGLLLAIPFGVYLSTRSAGRKVLAGILAMCLTASMIDWYKTVGRAAPLQPAAAVPDRGDRVGT